MTKADIIERVYEKMGGFSKQEAAWLVETTLEIIKDALVEGQRVKISSFGSFSVRSKRPRMGRNPKTGSPLEITARKVLTFKPSQVLRSLLNS